MLWLALIFPDLALECLPGLSDSPESWVLSAQGRVAVCNATARAHGIQPGHRLSAAYALDPLLQQRPREPAGELECLNALAEWALAFSAEVSLEGSTTLLLEVGSTQAYFGGLQTLRDSLLHGLSRRGHRVLEACAPTPLAALWMAQAKPGQVLLRSEQLAEQLGRLPLSCIGLPESCHAALQGAGIERISQILVLPASALARRFGPELPDLLRRALGQQPDPRLCIPPPQRFCRHVELAYPVHEVPRLMALLERMIPDLADWAWRNARMLTRIVLTLSHERCLPSRLEIGFAGTRSVAHLQLVIGESLQAQSLQAPVVAIALEILAAQEAPARSADLLPDQLTGAPSRLRQGQELLERLRARLGRTAVHGLVTRADHRPELAWAFSEPGNAAAEPYCAVAGPRPLWLLEQPRDLGAEALPRLGGPLCLLAGPERIESGWWDGHDIARDYFVASGPDGPQYWVYRERRGDGRWFLQGVFA